MCGSIYVLYTKANLDLIQLVHGNSWLNMFPNLLFNTH